MTRAVLRSAALSSLLATRLMSPILPTLKVPAKPYAKQNFERDCTKPTDATINGKKIPKRISAGASTVLNASKVEIEKNRRVEFVILEK